MASTDTTALARAVTRSLRLESGSRLGLALDDADLATAMASIAASAGAQLRDEGELDAAALELAGPPDPLLSATAIAVLRRVRGGGRVAVWLRAAPHQDWGRLGAELGPCLAIAKAKAERLGDGALVFGARREPLRNAERKRLRGLGHGIEASVLIGRGGLSDSLVATVRQAIERHGLIKVKLTPQATIDKSEAAEALAWATGSQLVQRIGKTALLYRPDVPLDPPVSRNPRKR